MKIPLFNYITKHLPTCLRSSLTSCESLWCVLIMWAFPLASRDALSIKSGRKVPEEKQNSDIGKVVIRIPLNKNNHKSWVNYYFSFLLSTKGRRPYPSGNTKYKIDVIILTNIKSSMVINEYLSVKMYTFHFRTPFKTHPLNHNS